MFVKTPILIYFNFIQFFFPKSKLLNSGAAYLRGRLIRRFTVILTFALTLFKCKFAFFFSQNWQQRKPGSEALENQ